MTSIVTLHISDMMKRTKKEIISVDEAAREIFRVFIQKGPVSRSLPKTYLLERLVESDVYSDFLKLCAENDNSNNLALIRKGLKLLIEKLGPTEIAKKAKINRATLYRMLEKDGNPSITTFITLLRAVGMHFRVVDTQFIEKRESISQTVLVSDWMPKHLLPKISKVKRKLRLP